MMNFPSKTTRSIQAMGAIKDGKKFLLRMPMGLYRETRAMADVKGWSITKYIVHCIAATVKREQGVARKSLNKMYEDGSTKSSNEDGSAKPSGKEYLVARLESVGGGKWFKPNR